MNYKEQIEWLRGFEIDHSPDGWPAIRMREMGIRIFRWTDRCAEQQMTE